MSDSVRPHRWQPTRLPHPWDSPGKNTGVGCHFLLQCMKVKSEREVAQSCLTLSNHMTAAYQAPPSMGFSRQENPLHPTGVGCHCLLWDCFISSTLSWGMLCFILPPILWYQLLVTIICNFPWDPGNKESACSTGDLGSIPRLGRYPREATHSSILAWRIPWTEEPDRLQSMGVSQRVAHDWETNIFTFSLSFTTCKVAVVYF